MMKQKYDIIYSIGRDCGCATYMKRAHLRACSGPFDWLTNADFETRIDLIVNGFKNFLNKKDLIPLQKNPELVNDKNCDYYQNTRNNFWYLHDFPVGIPLNKSFPDVQVKYKRRIKRFYDNVNDANNVLFIWFSQYHNTPDDVLLAANNRICKTFGKNIHFLVIEHSDNATRPVRRQISENIVRYNTHIHVLEPNGHLKTFGNRKHVQPIFAKYALNEHWWIIAKRHILRVTSNIVCVMLPFKKLRKKIKRAIRGKYL